MLKSIFLLSCLGAPCFADLRLASQPYSKEGNKQPWELQQRNRDVPFPGKYALYMEPSDFHYEGLKLQRDGGGYDNFLRSNIDNQQDRRNFKTENGKDHLPFRSYEGAAVDTDSGITVKHKMKAATAHQMEKQEAPGNHWKIKPGEPFNVPLRWNNPHSSEIEVNIWIMKKDGTKLDAPFVIPLKKPSCSGEGYQDNAFTFTIPEDFTKVASCKDVGDCVTQIYAHSVESRMYSQGTPTIVEGSDGTWNPPGGVKEAEKDRAFNLHELRRLCLPSGSNTQTTANHLNSVVYKARLSSDVYNHAYQNSDFSPYAGQQPQHISQNLQASCILKMTVGNFGELGKSYAPNEAKQYAKKLDKKARNLIRVYETTTNAIIEAIKSEAQDQVTLEAVVMDPTKYVKCEEWRDNYQNNPEGIRRGTDRTGGYCPEDKKCVCRGDCYLGHGKDDKEKDAICAEMEPTDNKKGLKINEDTVSDRVGYLAQKTETCFRCPEVGSIKVQRQNTNTYIPSFEIQGAENVNKALMYVSPVQLDSGFLTNPSTGVVTQLGEDSAILQIYMAVLTDMWPEFKNASTADYMYEHYPKKAEQLKTEGGGLEKYQLHYRGPVIKQTLATLEDATYFRKKNAIDSDDNGQYASSMAWDHQDLSKRFTHAVPQRDGPLLKQSIMQTNNMGGRYENIMSPNQDLKIKYVIESENGPVTFPKNSATSECMIQLKKRQAISLDITPEGIDMDGLNYDADCDDGEVVEQQMQEHNKKCDEKQIKDANYKCPPFEVKCVIEGENKALPTNMFLGEGKEPLFSDEAEDASSASSTISAVAGMVISLLFL